MFPAMAGGANEKAVGCEVDDAEVKLGENCWVAQLSLRYG